MPRQNFASPSERSRANTGRVRRLFSWRLALRAGQIALCLIVAAWILWMVTPRDPKFFHGRFDLVQAEITFDGPFHLAQRMWSGQVYFDERTSWWEMYVRGGRWYLVYAPLASMVVMPFTWITRYHLGQPMVNSLFLLGSAFVLWLRLRRERATRRWALWGAIGYLFGSGSFFSATQGNVWLLLHSEGNFFLTLAALAAVRRRWIQLGFFFALAVGCRHPLLFCAPFAVLPLLPRRQRDLRVRRAWLCAARRTLRFTLGALPVILVALALEMAMTGSPLVTTYSLGYEQWSAPRLYSTEFFSERVRFYALALPEFHRTFPYATFPTVGQSFWSVSPFFLLLPFARPSSRPLRAAVIAAITGFVPYLFFCWNGYAQYGSRYVTDLFPLIIPLACAGAARFRAWPYRLLAWLLLALSVAINTLAVWEVHAKML